MVGYGKELANAVATHLKEIGPIAEMHRDYCGTGFVYQADAFIYTHFHDGDPNLYPLHKSGMSGVIHRFSSEQEFVNWLSLQNDASLSASGSEDTWYANNQRVTLEKLKRAVGMLRNFSR